MDQRSAGEIARLAERRYRTFVEQSPLSTQVFAPDGTAITANAAWERLWGTTRDHLAGYNVRRDPQLAAKGMAPFIERAFAGEAVALPAVRYDPAETGRPGRPRWVRAHCYPVKDESGALLEVHLMLEDITAQREATEALARTEARYRELFENANDIVYTHDLDGRFTSVNRAGERATGYTRDELLGMSVLDVLPPEAHALARRMTARKVQEGAPATIYQLELLTKDGRRLPIEVSTRLIYEDGQPVGVQGIARDVTERRQVEASLRESEQRYRQLVEYAPEAIAVHRQGRLVYLNPAGARLVGAPSPEALLGHSIFEFVHPDFRAVVAQRVQQVQAEGNVGGALEEQFLRLDGQPIDVEVLATPVIYQGEPASQVIIRDITERKRTATRIASLQAVTAALSRATTPNEVAGAIIHEGYPAAGANGGIITLYHEASQELEMIAQEGYPAAAMVPWQRFPLTATAPTSDVVLSRAPLFLETAAEVVARYPDVAALHTSRATGALAALPLLVEGRVVGAMSLRFDGPRRFSPDDRAFMQALAAQCAVALDRARLYRAEQEARRTAETATRLREEFLSVAAHELKTPLTSLRAHTQLALRRLEREGVLEPERLARALTTIDAQADRLGQLVNQLLDVARIEAGKLSLQRLRADLVQLARNVAADTQTATPGHPICVEVPSGEPVWAEVDPLRIEQVLANLLTNAAKYSPPDAAIEVTVATIPQGVQMTVRDYGVGIPPDRRAGLFDRFYQAHGEGHYGGMGLGLYISKQIVELHGGTIAAEFPADGGSRFVLTLPAGAEAPAPRAHLAGTTPKASDD